LGDSPIATHLENEATVADDYDDKGVADDAAAPTWDQIKVLFNQTDIQHMQGQGLDLTDCSQVSGAASTILGVLNGNPFLMPPEADGGPWPKSQIDLFQAWVDAGAPCPNSNDE
jgi:hypothetical protein